MQQLPSALNKDIPKKFPKCTEILLCWGLLVTKFRSSHPDVFLRKGVLKPMPKCDFKKIADLHPTTLLKRDTGSDGSRGILQKNFS